MCALPRIMVCCSPSCHIVITLALHLLWDALAQDQYVRSAVTLFFVKLYSPTFNLRHPLLPSTNCNSVVSSLTGPVWPESRYRGGQTGWGLLTRFFLDCDPETNDKACFGYKLKFIYFASWLCQIPGLNFSTPLFSVSLALHPVV